MTAVMRSIAIVDAGSFVLPFDYGLIAALADMGVTIDFYCSRTRYNFEFVTALRSISNCRAHVYDVSSTVTSRATGAANYYKMLKDVRARAHSYAAIVLQYSVLPLLEWAVLGPLANVSYFVHEDRGAAHKQRASRMMRARWRSAHSLLFVSSSVRDGFSRSTGITPRRSAVVPHGPTPISPIPHEVNPVKKSVTPLLLYWGVVKPYKGIELLADVADLCKQAGFSIELHGKWMVDAPALRTRFASMKIRIVDKFLNSNELITLFGRGGVFVLPYVRSSQSGVMYTLLNYGCPFVATDEGDVGAFLKRHGLSQLLFSRLDHDSLIQAIRRAHMNYDDLSNALLCLREQHSWRLSAESLRDHFQLS